MGSRRPMLSQKTSSTGSGCGGVTVVDGVVVGRPVLGEPVDGDPVGVEPVPKAVGCVVEGVEGCAVGVVGARSGSGGGGYLRTSLPTRAVGSTSTLIMPPASNSPSASLGYSLPGST